MWRRWLPVVATAAILLEPGVALADQTVVILHTADARRRHAGIERELRRRGLSIAPPAAPSAATAARRKLAAHAVAAAIEAARDHYLAQEYDPAIAGLESVEAAHLATLVETRQGRDLLASIGLWLGALHAAAGRTDRALDRFALAVSVDPRAQLDASVWPPASVELFEDAGTRRRPMATLSIVVAEPARVALDGATKWRDPAEAQRVPAGLHYVLVRRLGHPPVAHLVHLRAGQVETVEVEGTARRHSDAAQDADLASGWYELDPVAAVRAVSRASGASRVIVVGARDLALHDASGRELARVSGGTSREALDTLLAEADLVVGNTADHSRRPIYTRWWFWTVIGAGVAAAAGGVYFATRDDDPLVGRFVP